MFELLPQAAAKCLSKIDTLAARDAEATAETARYDPRVDRRQDHADG
jgi:hypothetical protein